MGNFFLLVVGMWFCAQQGLGQTFPDAPSVVAQKAATIHALLADQPFVILQNSDGSLRKEFPDGFSVPFIPKQSRTLSNWFLLGHGVYLGALVFDVERTYHGNAGHQKCGEERGEAPSSRGALYRGNLLLFAAFGGLDYLLARPHQLPRWLPLQYEGAALGTAFHIKGGLERTGACL